MKTMSTSQFALGLIATTCFTACSAAPEGKAVPEAVAKTTSAFTQGGPALLWQHLESQYEPSPGALSAWVFDESSWAPRSEYLSARCGPSDGCSTQWNVIDTKQSSILWTNPTTGVVQAWTFDSYAQVSKSPALSRQCGAASGCSTTWRPIGRVARPDATCSRCGPLSGLVWHNASSGELSRWDFDEQSGVVTSATPLSAACGASDGCSSAWSALLTADFNGDGEDDILWHNATTGELSAWLLHDATVTGTLPLARRCDTTSGCATWQHVIGAADVNRDGTTDLTWINQNYEIQSWLLDGSGGVTVQPPLEVGGASVLKALGYARFPFVDKRLECGTREDGCGGTMSCGTCEDGLTCSANHCCDAGKQWSDVTLSCATKPVVCHLPKVDCGGYCCKCTGTTCF
jgi:hypothetical protein